MLIIFRKNANHHQMMLCDVIIRNIFLAIYLQGQKLFTIVQEGAIIPELILPSDLFFPVTRYELEKLTTISGP